MYQQAELSKDLSVEEFARILSLIGLSHQDSYTEDDADLFFKCRELINQGKNDEEILGILSNIKPLNAEANTTSQAPNSEEKPPEPRKKTSKPKTISNLLALASKRTNLEISLVQVINILSACGLNPESPSYSSQECDHFLEAAELILVKKQPLSEVIAHFRANDNQQKSDDSQLDQLVEYISSQAVQAGDNLTSIIDRITAQEALAVPDLISRFYLKNVLLHLQNGHSGNNLFVQLEERIMQNIAGKKSQKQITLTMEEMKPLPDSSGELMKLLPESENGTNTP